MPTTGKSAEDLFALLSGEVGDAVQFLSRLRIMATHPGNYVLAEIAPDFGDPSAMKPTYQIVEGVTAAVFERLSKVVNNLPEPGEQPDIPQFHLVIPSIRLRSGISFDDTFTLVQTFLREDSSYRSYDLAPVLVDSALTESDVRTANRLMARMSTATVDAVLASKGAIEAALKRIPLGASLAGGPVPWEALHALFAAFEGIPAVGLPRTTKILHKKRPALVPILDSVLEEYLVANHDVGSQQRLADRGIALTRAYQDELLENEDPLLLLRSALSSQGIELTECRLLDDPLTNYADRGIKSSTGRQLVVRVVQGHDGPRSRRETV